VKNRFDFSAEFDFGVENAENLDFLEQIRGEGLKRGELVVFENNFALIRFAFEVNLLDL
jgi:hypothetical protein